MADDRHALIDPWKDNASRAPCRQTIDPRAHSLSPCPGTQEELGCLVYAKVLASNSGLRASTTWRGSCLDIFLRVAGPAVVCAADSRKLEVVRLLDFELVATQESRKRAQELVEGGVQILGRYETLSSECMRNGKWTTCTR